jgi:hypothetical protein
MTSAAIWRAGIGASLFLYTFALTIAWSYLT